MKTKQYKVLSAGDVRQKGDEVLHNSFCANTDRDEAIWQPVRLLNHAILSSDTIVASFRRPI